jgi:putative mRNA 3-end processing factor
MSELSLITQSELGLRCDRGDFFVDPSGTVDCAVITHAHADHARPGSNVYHCTRDSLAILQHRLGSSAQLVGHEYREKFKLKDCWVSFYPAGHVLGSAQVRVEQGDRVWVVSGDYKRHEDPTCLPFEPVQCETFITEATFALPTYCWDDPRAVVAELFAWSSAEKTAPTLVFCYAFGKAQRRLAMLASHTDRPVYLHGAMQTLTQLYREQGVSMLETCAIEDGVDYSGALILAPPSAHRSAWMKRFKNPQTAFVSGWMAVRGNRRRRGYERGFALSDHGDWPSLLRTVHETRAKSVLVTHGTSVAFARHLTETHGLNARALRQLYEGDSDAT